MSKSRRQFLAATSLGVVGAAAAYHCRAQSPPICPRGAAAFGAGPAVGPEVSRASFAEAEKLVQVELADTPSAPWPRAVGARRWPRSMSDALVRARRHWTPRSHRVALDPALPGLNVGQVETGFSAARPDPGPLAANDPTLLSPP